MLHLVERCNATIPASRTSISRIICVVIGGSRKRDSTIFILIQCIIYQIYHSTRQYWVGLQFVLNTELDILVKNTLIYLYLLCLLHFHTRHFRRQTLYSLLSFRRLNILYTLASTPHTVHKFFRERKRAFRFVSFRLMIRHMFDL